jgi:hypothetical protein
MQIDLCGLLLTLKYSQYPHKLAMEIDLAMFKAV